MLQEVLESFSIFNQLKFSLNFPIQKGDVASNIPSQLVFFSAEEIIVLSSID